MTKAEIAGKSRPRRSVLALLGLVVLVAGTGFWVSERGLESTDDAAIDAEVVAVPARLAGIVTEVRFSENQRVKAGDVLAVLDDETAKTKLAQAEANLESAEAAAEAANSDARVTATNANGNKAVAKAAFASASAGANSARDQIKEAEAAVKSAESSLAQATLERNRDKSLYTTGAISSSAHDKSETALALAQANAEAARARLQSLRSNATQARTKVAEASAKLEQSSDVLPVVNQAEAKAKAARAAVATARALRDLAKLELSYTKIVAPSAGIVSKKSIAVGQAVGTGQTIVQLVTQNQWITANFKETQIGRMRVGQPVRIELDAFPGRELHGQVQSFAGATGSRFALLPPDNATGNFTKVVQRVPVRVSILAAPEDLELRPGMSVELTVNTR